ncbi:hypothetical protein MLD38_013242 [Melastoma candidum]|nr:hypothetical protein MLD38_013242 [Melastoma candidum]
MDGEAFMRDLLSIECARKLNEGLHLHHIRRNCPDPNSRKDAPSSRKFGRFNWNSGTKSDPTMTTRTERRELPQSQPDLSDSELSTFSFWVVALWILFGLGFLTITLALLSGCRLKKVKGKGNRTKRKWTMPRMIGI